MSEQPKHSDLITPKELRADALNAMSIDVTASGELVGLGESYQAVALRAIGDVTRSIEQFLDRKVIVSYAEDDIEDYQWNYNRGLESFQYYPKQYPIVQFRTEGIDVTNDATRMLSNNKEGLIAYYAGYRRVDQDLAALQGEYEDLDTLPEILPGDIRRVTFRLVMYELQMTLQNTFATATVTKESGRATATITRVREDVYEKELNKLTTYQRAL